MRLVFAGAPDVGATTSTGTQTSASGALMQMLIMLLIFFAMMYFLVILPQRREKEFRQMIESLKKGDTIITTGGVVGKIVDIKKDVVKIKSANSTELEIHKAYIAKVIKEKEEVKEETESKD